MSTKKNVVGNPYLNAMFGKTPEVPIEEVSVEEVSSEEESSGVEAPAFGESPVPARKRGRPAGKMKTKEGVPASVPGSREDAFLYVRADSEVLESFRAIALSRRMSLSMLLSEVIGSYVDSFVKKNGREGIDSCRAYLKR